MFCSIDASDDKHIGRYMNDSITEKAANVQAKPVHHNSRPHICFYALTDIKEGEELTYYYGPTDQHMFWRYDATAAPKSNDAAVPESQNAAATPELHDAAAPESHDPEALESHDTVAIPELHKAVEPELHDATAPESYDVASPESHDTAVPESRDTAAPKSHDVAATESHDAAPESHATAALESHDVAVPGYSKGHCFNLHTHTGQSGQLIGIVDANSPTDVSIRLEEGTSLTPKLSLNTTVIFLSFYDTSTIHLIIMLSILSKFCVSSTVFGPVSVPWSIMLCTHAAYIFLFNLKDAPLGVTICPSSLNLPWHI